MLKRFRRPLVALTAALTVATTALGVWALTATPAPADQAAKVTVSRYAPLTLNLPAMAADMRGAAYILDPDQCGLPAVLFCRQIPMHIDPPIDIAKGDDWFLIVTVDWPSKANNLDVYMFDDKQIKTKNPPAAGDTQSTSMYTRVQQATNSSGSQKPTETFTLPQPLEGNYNLDIEDVSGGTPFRVRAFISVAPFIAPFESLEDPITPIDFSNLESKAPSQGSTAPAAANASPVEALPAVPALALLPEPAADPDLGAIEPAKSTLASGPVGALPPVRRASTRRTSGATLLLWLVVVPGLIVGLPTGFLARRRRNMTWG